MIPGPKRIWQKPFRSIRCWTIAAITGESKLKLQNLCKTATLKSGFQDQLSLDAGQKYCRMLRGEHSAIPLTFIKLSFAIKMFVLSILSDRFRQVSL